MNFEEQTLTLAKPVVLGKGESAITYAEITLREPEAGELEKASRADTNTGAAITLISLIAKIPRTAVEKFSQRDLKAANDFLATFGADGQSPPAPGQE